MTITDCKKEMDKIAGETAQLCQKEKVLEAINILKELNKKFLNKEGKKRPLLDEATDCPVFLQITMKKIPSKRLAKRIKVPLPHSMVTDTTEVCLFTGDLDKRNKKAEIDPDVLHYKELLKTHGITNVAEVITLRQLRTEYKVFEAKRQLMAAYDVFLSDKKIAQCLPKLLGKTFIKKRKFPIQINMDTSNLKSQVEKALSETVFSINCRGNNCTSEVARLGMVDNEIYENILASVNVLADEIPGKQINIFGIYIKTAKSQAIPIFISFGNPSEVKMEKPNNYESVELEELSTLPNTEVKVFRDGKIFVKKTLADSDDEDRPEIRLRRGRKKRRMDAEAVIDEDDLEVTGESESVDEDAEEDISPSKTKLKKKHKTSITETLDDEEGDELVDSGDETEIHLQDEIEVEVLDENIDEDDLEVTGESKSVDEDAEEDISPSKTKLKKKHKTSITGTLDVEEGDKLVDSGDETEIHLQDEIEVIVLDEDIDEDDLKVAGESESVNEVAEEDISPSKTKLKKKHKTSITGTLDDEKGDKLVDSGDETEKHLQDEIEVIVLDEDIDEDDLKVTGESESVNEVAEEDITPNETKLKKKHKASVEETRGDEEGEESEEDTSARKTKLRNKHDSASVKNKVQEGENRNIRKRKSVSAVENEDLNTSTVKLKLRKTKTADIEIEEPVRFLRKPHTKVRNTRSGPGDKMNLRQRS